MSNIEAYEMNLPQRLEELRKGDQAQTWHYHAIVSAMAYAAHVHGQPEEQARTLDVGCGLGFLSKNFSDFDLNIVGIDPSSEAIALATQEHKGLEFYTSSAEQYPAIMQEKGIKLFDNAILNMVLHSVDDQTAINILKGVYDCLVPEGTVILIVPTEYWLPDALIKYALDQNMEKEPGLAWVRQQLRQSPVLLPYKIRNGEYYPSPINVYQRTRERYGELLLQSGFKVPWASYDDATGKHLGTITLPYLDLMDYSSVCELLDRYRTILLSFAFAKDDVT